MEMCKRPDILIWS